MSAIGVFNRSGTKVENVYFVKQISVVEEKSSEGRHCILVYFADLQLSGNCLNGV
jgi:hypothetical protein